MKKILSILLLTSIYLSSFGQADIARFNKTPLTGTNQNKSSVVDYNLKVMSNLYTPKGNSFTLNNGKDSSSALRYQDAIKRLGVYNGTSWDTLAFSKDFANYMKIADGLTRLDSIKVSGLTVTAYAPITWRISSVNYQKLTNSVFNIPAATNGYNRIDLLYATTSNTVLRLQGTETTGIAVAPVLPMNTISVALLYINGSVIQPPFPDLSGYVTYPYLMDNYYDKVASDDRYIYASPSIYQSKNIWIDGVVRIYNNQSGGSSFIDGRKWNVANTSGGDPSYIDMNTENTYISPNAHLFKVGGNGTDVFAIRDTYVSLPITPALDALPTQVLTREPITGQIRYVPSTSFGGGGGGAVSSVFGRTGAVTAQSGDYLSFYYPLSTNPAGYLTSVPAQSFASLTGKPTTLGGYGITDAYPLTGNPSGFLTSYTETDPLFNTKFSGKTTTDLAEGTNLYFTQGRVSANTDVAANTAARHNAVTIGTANGLSLAGQALSLGIASSGVTGALSGSDWNTFNAKQNQIVLTTTGSGAASLIGSTLNIPTPSGGGGSAALRVPVTLASNGTLIQITWATYSATFGANPTDLSLIELSATGDRQVFTNWYSDDNGVTYKFDVAPETGSRNFVVVISGGSTVTSGNVTSVTSANGDISVTNPTTTPVLTLNSGAGANQIVKRNGSGIIADLAPYLLSSNAAATYQTLANLSTDLTASSTKYPNVNAVNTGLSTKQDKIGYLKLFVKSTGENKLYTPSSNTNASRGVMLQQAFTDMAVGDVLEIGSGDYYLTTALTLKDSVNIIIKGATIYHTNTAIDVFVANNVNNVSISGNGFIRGSGSATSASLTAEAGLRTSGDCDNFKLSGINFSGFSGVAIYYGASSSTVPYRFVNGLIENCNISNNNVGVYVETEHVRLENITATKNKLGIYGYGGNLQLTDSYISYNIRGIEIGGASGNAGHGIIGNTSIIHNSQMGIKFDAVTIGMALNGNKFAGVYPAATTDSTIVINASRGVHFTGGQMLSPMQIYLTGTFSGYNSIRGAFFYSGDTTLVQPNIVGTTLQKNFLRIEQSSYLDKLVTPLGTPIDILEGGTGNTTGNALTATKLQTPRTIDGVSFDGTGNITLPNQTLQTTTTAGNTTTDAIRITGVTNLPSTGAAGLELYHLVGTGSVVNSINRTTGVRQPLFLGGSSLIYLDTGNVGIGANNPAYKLTVTGKAAVTQKDLGVAGTDSILVSHAATGLIKRIAPNYYLPITGGTVSGNLNAAQIGGATYFLGSTGSYTGRLVDGGTYVSLDTYNGTSIAKELRLQGTSVTVPSAPVNPTDVVRLQDLPITASGTYTPTVTITNNGGGAVTGVNAFTTNYMRVGNQVTVSGLVQVTTVTSNTGSVFEITLPISSNLTLNTDVTGLANLALSSSTFTGNGTITPNTTNKKAVLTVNNPGGTANVYFNFMYIIK